MKAFLYCLIALSHPLGDLLAVFQCKNHLTARIPYRIVLVRRQLHTSLHTNVLTENATMCCVYARSSSTASPHKARLLHVADFS
jgi:hypothetical protein